MTCTKGLLINGSILWISGFPYREGERYNSRNSTTEGRLNLLVINRYLYMLQKIARVGVVVPLIVLAVAMFAPQVTLALGEVIPDEPQINDVPVRNLTTLVANVLDAVVPIVITLALIYFIWGLAEYILAAGDPEKKSEGKTRMIYGVIALFVIVSIWGLVGFLGNVLGVGQGGTAPTPNVQR